jgi:DNA-binding CsgD family transcriptional regulator
MSNFIGGLYSAVLDHQDHFTQWSLSAMVEKLPMSQARWAVIQPAGQRELAVAGEATQPRTGEFTTLRLEVLEPVEHTRHEFTWQRSLPAVFTEEERKFLSETLEHLVRAERLSRRLQGLLREAKGGELDPIGFAIVDEKGVIESADRAFEDYVRRAQDGWDGTSLPFDFVWEPRYSTTGLAVRGLFFRIDQAAGKFHVRVRKDRRQPSVSSREMQVAQKLAGGMTFKEIARDLNLAPSTVSTHAYNLYDKLGFRRRAQLVEWVHKNGGINGRSN